MKSARFLIVDDEPANVKVLKQMLELAGYLNVVSTTNPRQVVSLFMEFKPDLVLLDLMMPFLNGFQVMEQLESLIPPQSYLPVIVLTADTNRETRRKALAAGAKDFLTKPFDQIELMLRVGNLLEARFMHLQLQEYNEMLEEKVEERTRELALAHEEILASRNELEIRVRERTAQLEAANEEMESFSYSVSHDLRAPLRGIIGFTQVLAEDYSEDLGDQGRAHLDKVMAAGRRMEERIEALLGLSQVARKPIQKEDLDLTAIARSIAAELQVLDSSRQVDLIIQENLRTVGDPGLLNSVLDNLLHNAWKFTRNCVAGRIEVGSMEQDGELVYFVRDNGAGFSMQYADKLFGAFQRLHSSSEFAGTGIGLATVQRIIHRHGGRIWAEAKVGEGAVFCFTLPG